MKANTKAKLFILNILTILFLCFFTKPNHIECKASTTSLYLMGDSKVANSPQSLYPRVGWGSILYKHIGNTHFETKSMNISTLTSASKYISNKLIIKNYSKGGISTKTYINQNIFNMVLSNLKSNDYVIIALGHNDCLYNNNNVRTSTKEYYNNLKYFIRSIKSKHAIPILTTIIPKNPYVFNYKIVSSKNKRIVYQNKQIEKYNKIIRTTSKRYYVPLLDLHNLYNNYYKNLSPSNTSLLYCTKLKNNQKVPDETHLNYKGANIIANFVTSSILSNKYSTLNTLKRIMRPNMSTLKTTIILSNQIVNNPRLKKRYTSKQYNRIKYARRIAVNTYRNLKSTQTQVNKSCKALEKEMSCYSELPLS